MRFSGRLAALGLLLLSGSAFAQQAAPTPDKPNILVIFGDDIGQSNISAYTMGVVGYRTPHIDSIAQQGAIFTDYYAEQSCTAGRSTFITGQCTLRTGLSKVACPARPSDCRRVM
jgi:arylsulfatase